MSVLGVPIFLALVVLPGAWLTFGMSLRGLSAWDRFLIGVALSPVVGGTQFLLLRWIGVPFAATPPILLVANIPVLFVAAKRIGPLRWPSRNTVLGTALIAAVPLAFLIFLLYDPAIRAFSGHTWMHGDIIYQFAAGRLHPEEPNLAGVVLSYPWFTHTYQAVLSRVQGTPPTTNYFITNLIWLLIVFGLIASVVRQLGGNRLSQVFAITSVAFAVNFVGGVLQLVVPPEVFQEYPIPLWGDWRFTPFIRQFLFFNQMPFGLALFAAALVLLTRDPAPSGKRSDVLLLAVVLGGVAIAYPMLFPPAAVVVAGRALGVSFTGISEGKGLPWRQVLGLAVAALVGALLTYGYLGLLGVDRAGAPSIGFLGTYAMKLKAFQILVVLSPLLVALLVTLREQWRTRPVALITLTTGALGSAVAYILFHIPHHWNEYKFVFAAALCLAPYGSLAIEPLASRFGRRAWIVPGLITLVLAAGGWQALVPPFFPDNPPAVELGSFDLRLAASERYAGVTDAVRAAAPSSAVLVAERTPVHLPTLTHRSLYVPFENATYPGVNLSRDQLLVRIKGYDQALLDERLSVVGELFDEDTPDERRVASLDRILEIGRPLVVIVDDDLHPGLTSWLADREDGSYIYRGEGLGAWLVGSEAPVVHD